MDTIESTLDDAVRAKAVKYKLELIEREVGMSGRYAYWLADARGGLVCGGTYGVSLDKLDDFLDAQDIDPCLEEE